MDRWNWCVHIWTCHMSKEHYFCLRIRTHPICLVVKKTISVYYFKRFFVIPTQSLGNDIHFDMRSLLCLFSIWLIKRNLRYDLNLFEGGSQRRNSVERRNSGGMSITSHRSSTEHPYHQRNRSIPDSFSSSQSRESDRNSELNDNRRSKKTLIGRLVCLCLYCVS